MTIIVGGANSSGSMSSISLYTRFMSAKLEEMFEREVKLGAARDNTVLRTSRSYVVRWDWTARQMLPEENWGIVGKSDVVARQIVEHAAQSKAEADADDTPWPKAGSRW